MVTKSGYEGQTCKSSIPESGIRVIRVQDRPTWHRFVSGRIIGFSQVGDLTAIECPASVDFELSLVIGRVPKADYGIGFNRPGGGGHSYYLK